jgi:4-hydroxybenzoate polyprenyltransferase
MSGTGVLAAVREAAGDIKIAHSVFAMPFAVLGAVMAWGRFGTPGQGHAVETWGQVAGQLGLVVACMVLARTWAMLVNRLADAGFDAANPRTARRAVAAGRLGARAGWVMAMGCAGMFAFTAAGFWWWFANPWPVVLAVPVLGWLALYSYAKRFTWLCHVLLGTALAISPLAAALAVRPAALVEVMALYALSGMVVLWVAGFDVIYALQDTAFDRSRGLFSVPARLGVRAALWLSRAMHTGAWACLAAAWWLDPRFGVVFGAALVLVAGLLVFEHVHLARRGEAGLEMAFFTVNGVVSCVVGVLGVVNVVW